MVRKSLTLLIIFIIFSISIVGCKKKSDTEVQPVSAADAKQSAEKEINQDNLDSELEKMQNEIQADTDN